MKYLKCGFIFNILAEIVLIEVGRSSMDFKADYRSKGEWSRPFATLMSDIILLATSEAELQELVDRLRPSQPRIVYSST